MREEHLASCFCGRCVVEAMEDAELGEYFEFSDDTAKEISVEIAARESKAALLGLVIGAVLGVIIGGAGAAIALLIFRSSV